MSSRRRFTDRFIQGLQPRDVTYEEREGEGFGVRVLPSGTKSFFFVYDAAGRRRRITLGRYPAMTLAMARDAARALQLERAAGADPGQALEERRRGRERDRTIAWLVSEYIERYAKLRKKTWREDERLLAKYVVPVWGDRAIESIARRDVITWCDDLVEVHGLGVGANRVFAVNRKMFNWAVTRDLVQSTPCSHVQPPVRESVRDRELSEAEVAELWKRLESASMSEGAKLILKLQLATGLRVGEVSGASWAEIGEDDWWTIPAERSKNGRAHRVPLSTFARSLLARARALSGDSPWVFPGPGGERPVHATSLSHALARHRDPDGKTLGLPYFTTHDLRRTTASRLAQMGTPQQVISKILNHTPKTVTDRVYDKYSYDSEKRVALEAWGKRLSDVVV